MVVNLCYKYWYPDVEISIDEKHNFETKVDEILKNPLSWKTFLCSNGMLKEITLSKHVDGCNCTRISRVDGGVHPGCQMQITLVSNAYLTSQACPGLEDDEYTLSCTRVPAFSDIAEVFINKTNWDIGFDNVFVPKKYKKYKPDSKELYYKYVIYHEVGHALGRGHYIPRNKNNEKYNNGFPAPIMMQQTKGLFGYDVNVFPLKQEQGLFCEIRECHHHQTCKEFLTPL
jgi:hypothetical protein